MVTERRLELQVSEILDKSGSPPTASKRKQKEYYSTYVCNNQKQT